MQGSSSLQWLITAVLIAGTGSPALAQPPQPLGDIFPVNATTSLNQSAPELATDLDGAFVSVWTSEDQDGSGLGIFAQIFDEDGNADGPEFPVNATTAGDQTDPEVSMNDEQDFAITWIGPDADGTGIYLRIFEEGAATTMVDVPVNTTTAGLQSNPDVAFAEDGQVLVVWQSPDGDGEGIFGRFFDVEGVPLSVELPIATTITGDQTLPVAADVDEDGSFVVAWEGNDAQGRGIFAQRLEDTGSLLGGEISVNTTTAGDQVQPTLGVRTNDDDLEDNGFVISWQGPDGDGSGIFAQFFNEDGSPVGGEIQVNVDDASDQFDPDVSIDDQGDYVITWAEPEVLVPGDRIHPQGSPILIRGRRFTPMARLAGTDPSTSNMSFTTNEPFTSDAPFTIASGALERPAVAVEANGDFAVVWQDADDGSGSGIFGQRFSVATLIFQDGFESGTTASWSSTMP